MSTYNIELVDGVLKVGFGEPATNQQIVKDAATAAEAIKDKVAGKLLKVNGPASLPVAMVLSHVFAHVVPAIACFDPKLGGYVVAVSHDPSYQLGDLIQ